MASQDHIRNPIEWSWGQLSLAALTVGSLGRSLRGSEESQYAAMPAVSRVKTADLRDALIKGLDDFAAYRTDVIFLCLIYPLAGIVLLWLTFGYDMLPLLFPLASGFALIGPVAAVGLYEMSRRREQGTRITWMDAFGVIRSPGFGAILVLGLVLLAIFLLWLLTANLIYQTHSRPRAAGLARRLRPRCVHDTHGLGDDRSGSERGFPLRRVGVGNQRGFVSVVAGPGCRTFHRGVDVDPSGCCEPAPDGRLGPDRRRQPGDRVDTRIPWSHRRDARARARHLALVPEGGAVSRQRKPFDNSEVDGQSSGRRLK